MKQNNCELVFILDRSGSMGGLESDTIGGFNSMLKKQQTEQGRATVTTVLFDDKYEILHDRIDLNSIDPITEKQYYVRGTTALLDAMGKTINKIQNVQKNIKSDARADKVLFVIITDGLENASREYNHAKIKSMVCDAKEKDYWEFIFLGANIDAISTAKDYGISPENAANYHADHKGTEVTYAAVANAVSQLRSKSRISKEWKHAVEEYYEKRNNN